MGLTYSVWVDLQGELPISGANILVGCVSREPEQVVGVDFWIVGHQGCGWR